MMAMHIGINALSIIGGETGGGETYLSGIVRGLADIDAVNNYTIFVGPESRETFEIDRPNFRCVSARVSQRRRLMRVLYEQLTLPGLARREGVDVLYCPGNAAALRARCALVLGVQSMLHVIRPREVGRLRTIYFRNVMPASARRAEKVIAVSEDCKKVLLESVDIPAEKVSVVHEGVTMNFRQPSPPEIERELQAAGLQPGFILFVGTLSPYKNADKLIAAFAHLRREFGEDRHLVFIGGDWEGYAGELQQLTRKLSLEAWVHFLGPMAHERLPYFYAGASVFSLPSSIETFGLPVLEAMACGTPVIGSNCSAIPEIVGDAGLIVDPTNTVQYAEAIRRVLREPELRATLKAKGYERVKHFNWQRAARETLAVFEEAYRIRMARGR
jgi:glycosyltransferase involved in cell wall biosynthesis